MEVTVYTDASFDDRVFAAVCGFISLVNGKKECHRIVTIVDLKRSHDPEMYAVIMALQHCFLIKNVTRICVHSDVDVFSRKDKRFKPNAWHYYREYIETLEIIKDYGIEVKFFRVKGHSNHKWNTEIDVSCRTALRQHVRDNHYGIHKGLPQKNETFGYYDNWY